MKNLIISLERVRRVIIAILVEHLGHVSEGIPLILLESFVNVT